MRNWYRNMRSRSVNGFASLFFFISLCFVISVFILEREQRSKAALQVFAALYAKFTQIAADNANEENGRERLKREREVKSLERKQRQRKLKAIFNFLSWRKLKNLLQPPAHTHTHTHKHIYICTHRDKLKFVFRYLKIPRSCAQASRN